MKGDPNVGSSSSSANKKSRLRSAVWNDMIRYIDKDDGKVKAKCMHCGKSYDAPSNKGTTRHKNHLNRCPANPKRKRPAGGRDGDDQHQSLSSSLKTKELASLIKEKSVRGLIEHFKEWEDTSDEKVKVLDASLKSRKDEILQLYQEEKEKFCQFLNNFSCRFSLLLHRYRGRCFLVVCYIDDSWKRQSKFISYWGIAEDVIKAVKQSCLDWNIHRKICSVVDIYPSYHEDELSRKLEKSRKLESWLGHGGSFPFARFIDDVKYFMHNIQNILCSQNYAEDLILHIQECAWYVGNKLTSDTDGILYLAHGPSKGCILRYFDAAVRLKETFVGLEKLDSDFKSINLTEQKWDEVTATLHHLKFLCDDVATNFLWTKCEIPIIVDLPYVHEKLRFRYNHSIEDCLFCEKVMKQVIDLYLSKNCLFRVIAVILDPRFKMDGVQLHYKQIYGSDADRYLEKVNKDFRKVYDAYADSSNSQSYKMLDAMGRPSSPKSELDLYMKELKVPAVQQFDILSWWRGNAPFYPTLAKMARDYLALEIRDYLSLIASAYKDPVDALLGMGDDFYYFYSGDEVVREIIWSLVCLKRFLR